MKSKQGAAILDALELLDGETLKPRNSRYGKNVLDALSQKGQGQVLNRSELIASESGVDYWTKFRIEPEFLSVVLAALVHSGDIVLSLAGKKIDAAGIDQFAKIGIAEVTEFKHIDRPRDLPLGPLQDLCDLLDVPKGLIVNPANRDDGVAKIQQRAAELLGKVVASQARIAELIFWGRPILSEQEQKDWKDRLGSLKGFLESLQPFNTSGKLKNFPHDSAAVLGQKPAIELAREVDELGVAPAADQSADVLSRQGRGAARRQPSLAGYGPHRARRSHGQDRQSEAAVGVGFQKASHPDAGGSEDRSIRMPIWRRMSARAWAPTTTSARPTSPRIRASRSFRKSPASI